ncbi:hypothetical protein AAFF_G00158690 [Aldrovandia affinis]|uniref:Uncharacterized protein n=1 Tax=Aldrovandia affinis TaxID=143900 RepID=A0AAD7RQQ8_9TELE|nr:hypothetical protein AAFF_G00158690 [Aldrovandia affinis]
MAPPAQAATDMTPKRLGRDHSSYLTPPIFTVLLCVENDTGTRPVKDIVTGTDGYCAVLSVEKRYRKPPPVYPWSINLIDLLFGHRLLYFLTKQIFCMLQHNQRFTLGIMFHACRDFLFKATYQRKLIS